MIKTLLALDIDETLNSLLDHKLLCDADDDGRDEQLYPSDFEGVLKFCNITNGGNCSEFNLGMYVNVEQLKAFNELREEFDADVLGTSSWFCGGRDDRKVAGFLDIPDEKFIGSGDTGGSVGRCKSVAEAVLEGGYNRVIVLDDQYFGWELFGLDAHRPPITGAEGFNAECQRIAREIQGIEIDHEKLRGLLEQYRTKR
ncbi:hypothetical protein pVa21_195 [Vibrio phage pVa-21]|nr:hypothetical protein pVa21_195 [Vibrio phage pVa-21]